MKKRVFFILSIIFLTTFLVSGAQADDVKIINYNVWFGIDGHGDFKMGEYEYPSTRGRRYDLLVSGLSGLNPDIIGIQEGNKLPAYARRLGRDIGYDTVWKIGNSGVKVLGFGLPVNFIEGEAIFAKKGYDLKFLGSKRLSGRGISGYLFSFHQKEVRYAMAAMVEISGRPLVIFNTHIHFSLIMDEKWRGVVTGEFEKGEITAEERDAILLEMEESHERTEAEIYGLMEFVREITAEYDHPYVIMGDFNTTLDSLALRDLIDELGLIDPYRIIHPDEDGYTWNPDINTNTAYDGSHFWADGKALKDPLSRLEADFDLETPRRIDFILLSHHFTPDMVKDANLIFTEPIGGIFVSDHFGVEVVVDGIPE